MSRARDVSFAAASVVFGGMWLLAAGAKVWTPLPAYEFLARAMPAGPAAKAVFVSGVAAESLLGALMLLRAIPPARAFAATLGGLAAVSALLLVVRSKAGGQLQCGCYGHVIFSSIDGELTLNAALAAILITLLVWARTTRPRTSA